MTLSLKEISTTLHDHDNPFFTSSTKMMEKVRDQWLKGIELEKKMDREYRKDFEDEIQNFGNVDDNEERWKNQKDQTTNEVREWFQVVREDTNGFSQPRDLTKEMRILEGIQTLLNQMISFTPERSERQEYFTDDEVEKIDLYKMKD